MAWVCIDDLTGQRIVGDEHRLDICLDGVTIRGWDVAAGNPDDLVAALARHLAYVFDGVVDAEIVDHDSGACPDDPDGLHHAGCGCDGVDPINPNDRDHGATPGKSVENDIPAGQPDPEPQVSEPVPADESASDEPDVVHIGEGNRGRASDATVRAWCARWDVPCSKTGKLNQSARDAYERAGGGEPDDQTVRDDPPATTNGHVLPADPPRSSLADDETHYPGDGCTPPHPQPGAPAVEPLGQHLTPRQMTHAQRLDEAERLLAQRQTPAQVAAALELEVSEVRDLLPRPGGRRR